MARRKVNTQRLSKQLTELVFAAPQVVMHRTSRMARTSLSARDQAEFSRMGIEKVAAFYQSWASMWTAAVAVQYDMAAAATKVMSAGLDPVHKKAVANAKRLSRSKR